LGEWLRAVSRRVWDALTGDELHSFEHKHIVRTCAFSESTTHLLTGGAEKILRIFDLNRPDAPPTILEGSPGTPIRAAVWHHSDQTILSSSNDMGGVRIWDVRTKAIVRTLDTKSSCTSVEVSRDSNYITTADGNTVKFWDANHFGLVKSYTMPRPVESASLFPSRSKFIAGGDDMWVRLFDFTTGDEIECNKGHHGPVHCVRFSPGGESYASGSEDGTIRIWRTVSGTEEFEVGSFGNSDVSQIRVGVDEVVRKVEGFHITQENGSDS
jgi:serine-threonine kinase receptor-associated protein